MRFKYMLLLPIITLAMPLQAENEPAFLELIEMLGESDDDQDLNWEGAISEVKKAQPPTTNTASPNTVPPKQQDNRK